MARVLVTGASGFIGGHLSERLVQQGDRVRCLIRPGSPRRWVQHLPVEFCDGDITDAAAMRRAVVDIDLVYHCAGRTSSPRRSELCRVNGGGSGVLAAACAARPSPPTLIYLSSIAAAGPSPRCGKRAERDGTAPVSDYGRSKRGGELAIAAWSDHVPTTVVRPGIVFGPRNREMLPMFRTIHRMRMHFSPGFRDPPLSYIYIDDLVELLVRAARDARRLSAQGRPTSADAWQGFYFAVADEYPTYSQFGRLVAQALQIRPCLVLPVAFPLPWIAAGITEAALRLVGHSSSFNLDKICEAVEESWACSGEAAARDLSFRVSQPLASRLRITADWYRTTGWL